VSDDRFHRPEPPRAGPYRDFANILRSAGPRSDPDQGDPGETPEPPGSFVAEGVRAAYEVVDAYLRQGQHVARTLGLPSYERIVPANRLNELSARWIQASGELVAIGLEFLGSLAEGMAAVGYAPLRPPGALEPCPPRARSVAIHYEIASSRPALPHCEFLPGRETVSLASHGLRCLEVGHATIPVEFEPDAHESRVLVRIRVPDGQPPGLYSDTLLDAATGESVGTLSLKLR
jgi:hypothetical protein